MKKEARRTILILTIGSLLLLGILWFWFAPVPGPRTYEPMPASPAARDALVLTLLKQKLKDDKNWEDRVFGVPMSHIGQMISDRLWDRLYPRAYAEPILVNYGSDIVDPLTRIMNDPAQEEKTRGAAAHVLGWFDDPKILAAYHEAARQHRLSSTDLRICLSRYLPPLGQFVGIREVDEWFEANAGKGYVELTLELLDSVMEDRLAIQSTPTLRWLNRLYDVDFDAWLAEKAPQAMAFRKAHLRKGYDPAMAFEVFRVKLRGVHNVDAGINTVFSDLADRSACRQLIEAVYDNFSPYVVPRTDGWEDRLQAWYRENRPFLVYDFGKHRFVVRDKALGLLPQQEAPLKPPGEAPRAGLPEVLTLELAGGVAMEFVLIPAGDFLMGSPDSEPRRSNHEGPQHRVRITRPFYLGKYEVTLAQWMAVMRSDAPPLKSSAALPATRISGDEYGSVAFCRMLSMKTRRTIRLPTEAEWEYACRAGSSSAYCFGDSDGQLGDYAWYCINSGDAPHPVGTKKPNAWGLYDMHGNVWEWCRDRYSADAYAAASAENPTGPQKGEGRVLRGGSWDSDARYCRSACRGAGSGTSPNAGFRVVAEVP